MYQGYTVGTLAVVLRVQVSFLLPHSFKTKTQIFESSITYLAQFPFPQKLLHSNNPNTSFRLTTQLISLGHE